MKYNYRTPKKNKNFKVRFLSFYDQTREIPKQIEFTSYDEIIHGGTAINKQIGVPHLRKETFDIDVFTEKPLETAKRNLNQLNKRYGEVFELKEGRHKGTWKIKLNKFDKTIADFTKPYKPVSYVVIDNRKYADLSYFKSHIKETLKDKGAEFRKAKELDTLKRIEEYERNYKNISKKQFRNNPKLIKEFGKWNNTDEDYENGKPVLNWEDCYPFDPTRQGWLGDRYRDIDSRLGGRLPGGVKKKPDAVWDLDKGYAGTPKNISDYKPPKSKPPSGGGGSNPVITDIIQSGGGDPVVNTTGMNVAQKEQALMVNQQQIKQNRLKLQQKNWTHYQQSQFKQSQEANESVEEKFIDSIKDLPKKERLAKIRGYYGVSTDELAEDLNKSSTLDSTGEQNGNNTSRGREIDRDDNNGSSSSVDWKSDKKEIAKEIGENVWDYTGGFAIDAGKGVLNTGLYSVDTATDISSAIGRTKYGKEHGWRDVGKFSDILPEKTKKWLEYDYDMKMYSDPRVQKTYMLAGMVGLSTFAPAVAGYVGKGAVGYQGYQTIKDPSPENVGRLIGIGIVPEIINRGTNSVRVKLGYKKALKGLTKEFGKSSKEVNQFNKMWNRAFNELPRSVKVDKSWSSAQVEKAWGNAKIQKITNNVIREYKPEIIGSTTIKPQTSLTKLPRGKAGDVDIQNVPSLFGSNSKKMAFELFSKLKANGYNVKLRENDFFGKPKYHITIDGKEFVNIGTTSQYFLDTQAKPLINWYDPKKLGAWTKDPHGVKMGNIRDQMRVKLWKGFVEKSRPKDIVDAMGILKGTNKMFKGSPKIPSKGFNEASINKFYGGTPKTSGYYSLSNQQKYIAYKSPKKDIYSKGYKNNYSSKYQGGVYPKKYKTPYSYGYSGVVKAPYGGYKPIKEPNYANYKGEYVNIIPPKQKAYTTKGEKKVINKKGQRLVIPISTKQEDAFVPVMVTDDDEYIFGEPYETYKGAVEEGQISTDEEFPKKFIIKKIKVPKNRIKKARASRRGYKFHRSKGTYYEKKRYTNDKSKEGRSGRFNWMKLMNKKVR
jgi:hypothetical protein